MSSSRERDVWLGELRARFVSVARRRLPEDAVEDVVQDALRVVHEKGEEHPELPWCFQVLRNTIGNWYQKQRVRSRDLAPEDAAVPRAAPTPLEALEDRELGRVLAESVAALGTTDAGCGRYLERLMAGETPATIAGEEGVDPAVLYRRIYRCRGKLREILIGKGVVT